MHSATGRGIYHSGHRWSNCPRDLTVPTGMLKTVDIRNYLQACTTPGSRSHTCMAIIIIALSKFDYFVKRALHIVLHVKVGIYTFVLYIYSGKIMHYNYIAIALTDTYKNL